MYFGNFFFLKKLKWKKLRIIYFWCNKPSWIKLIVFDVVHGQSTLHIIAKEDLLEQENQLKCWSPLSPEQIFALASAGSMWEANCTLPGV